MTEGKSPPLPGFGKNMQGSAASVGQLDNVLFGNANLDSPVPMATGVALELLRRSTSQRQNQHQ